MRQNKYSAVFPARAGLVFLAVVCAVLAMTERGLAGVYQHLEASFNITNLTTNPFDYTVTDVEVQIMQPDGSVITLPAFFAGGNNWLVRHSPQLPGVYSITNITMNGSPLTVDSLQPTNWTVAGNPIARGYVELDPTNSNRFITSDGRRYFPVGENVAWDTGRTGIVTNNLARLGPSHANWARIWMAPWDSTSLETGYAPLYSQGVIPMTVAHKWDGIVQAAEQNGIRFQFVLENFVEYNTWNSFSYWSENPWNTANGGFLSNPTQYFTNTLAITYTKQMMRYAAARWGYSSSIMAWELFNEVELSDALYLDNQTNTVTQWHINMAGFIRSQDAYHHLITTSSMSYPEAYWAPCDYYQHHDYTSDNFIPDTRNAVPPQIPIKPIFGGECGTNSSPNGVCVAFWAGLMNGQSGNDEPWWWDGIDQENGYIWIRAVSDFIKLSGMPEMNSVQISQPTASSSGSQVMVYQVNDTQSAALWMWNNNNVFAVNPTTPESGTFSLSGLQAGNYNGTWWEPLTGTVISNFSFTISGNNSATITTPSFLRATALYVGPPPQAGLIVSNLTLSLGTNAAALTLPVVVTNGGGSPLTYSLMVTGATSVAYSALDSTQVGGPVFQWHDISPFGTEITTNFTALTASKPAKDEGIAGPFNIGFGFPFYNTSQSPNIYSQLYVSPDGFVTFSPFAGDQSTNLALPNASAPTNLIAPFWTDLTLGSSSHVYTLADPLEGTFTIEFLDAQLKTNSATMTFELILKTSGEILVQYESLGASGVATVGVQNALGSAGLNVAFDQNYPTGGLALSLTPIPWLGLSANAGVVPRVSADTVSLSINPAGLSPGTNKATVLITTADPNNPAFIVPVEVDVTASPVPTIVGYPVHGPGGISLYINGPQGQGYRLLMTTNLDYYVTNWTEVTSGIFGSGPVNYTNQTTEVFKPRFYRVVSP